MRIVDLVRTSGGIKEGLPLVSPTPLELDSPGTD